MTTDQFIAFLRKQVEVFRPGSLPFPIRFSTAPELSLEVAPDGDGWRVSAGDRAGFARGLGFAMAGRAVRETTSFRRRGIMLDCSRGRVFSVEYLKQYFFRIALMGYNEVYLYCEDTYVLPDEPRFGYMRGGYTMEELRELDVFAGQLGIELIGCIQTLGHLEQIMRWGAYGKVRDAGGVLLADEPETYRLIEKMIAFWRSALTSNRIHIGMDEAHDLGRGEFLTRHGYEEQFEIFNRHLGKVAAICRENRLEPIIWSDMYFRMGSATRDYYDLNAAIPESVWARVPDGVQLCYWDYYHSSSKDYEAFFSKHHCRGNNLVFASGVWTWYQFWYDHEWTRKTVVPGVAACRNAGIDEIFFTMWGDNGAYCSPDSAFLGLEFASGVLWGEDPDASSPYAERLNAICGMDYRGGLELSRIGKHYWNKFGDWPDMILAENILWDDPLFLMGLNNYRARKSEVAADAVEDYRGVLSGLEQRNDASGAIRSLIGILRRRFDYGAALTSAYETRDRVALKRIAEQDIPELQEELRKFDAAFREEWLRTSKPFGLEVIQRRNAGVIARFDEATRRIAEYLSGRIASIPELDASLAGRGTYDPVFKQYYSGGCNL